MSETLFHCESSDGFRMKFRDLWKSIAEMTVEHYMAPGKTIFVNSGIMYPDEEPDRTTIFYNLEHKYPIDENGHLKYCKPNWTEYVNTRYAKMDEIWDFQIENYEYFKFHGLGDKFRFKPLRYTTWFERFHTDKESEFEISLECMVDTDTRKKMLEILTSSPFELKGDNDISRICMKMVNTEDISLKYKEKMNCKYGIDIPHYDTPETYNCLRIYEYICMNKPCIVIDPYEITMDYFGDLCKYIKDPSFINIKTAAMEEPRKDVAEAFKNMTYEDKDFDAYRLKLIKEYSDKTGTAIPDSVML